MNVAATRKRAIHLPKNIDWTDMRLPIDRDDGPISPIAVLSSTRFLNRERAVVLLGPYDRAACAVLTPAFFIRHQEMRVHAAPPIST